MMFVKRGELGGNGLIGRFEAVGRFSDIREVKDYAWAYCQLHGTRCLYLCQPFAYLGEAPQMVLLLDRENGYVSFRQAVVDKSNQAHALEAIVKRFLSPGMASASRA